MGPCAIDNGGCDPLVQCSVVSDAVTCGACPSGYTGNGDTGCVDIDECATDNGGCGDATYNSCANNPGAAPTCADIDECATDNGGCGDATYYACTDNVGAPPSCADIDECATNNGACDPVAECDDNEGAAPTCTCPAGYSGDGATCDIIDCLYCSGTWSPTGVAFSYTCETTTESYVCLGMFPEWGVRDAEIGSTGRFAVNPGDDGSADTADDTVSDTLTGLEWQRAAPTTGYDQAGALAYCDSLSLAGHDDWRLPTIYELRSIIDRTRASPAIDPIAFPGTERNWYRSSTTYTQDPTGFAWLVVFDTGEVAINSTTNTNYRARCVR